MIEKNFSCGVNSAVVHDGLVFVACEDKSIKRWDTLDDIVSDPFSGHTSPVKSINLCPSGKRVVSGGYDDTVRLWDASSGRLLTTLHGHESWVNSACFHSLSQRHVISGSFDKTIKLWDTKTGENMSTFKGHSGCVNSVDCNPKGDQIASAGKDKTIRLWDSEYGKLLCVFRKHRKAVNWVSFGLDYRTLISGGDDGKVILWDLMTYEIIQEFRIHSDGVTSVALNHLGDCFASGGYDNLVKVWNLTAGKQMAVVQHSSWISSVCFNLDDTQIISSSRDCFVKIKNL
jgi:WD40 repeat protein